MTNTETPNPTPDTRTQAELRAELDAIQAKPDASRGTLGTIPRTWNGRRYLVTRAHAPSCHACELAEVTAMALATMKPRGQQDATFTYDTAADEWADAEPHAVSAAVVPEPKPEPLTNRKMMERLMGSSNCWMAHTHKETGELELHPVQSWEQLERTVAYGFTNAVVEEADGMTGHTHQWGWGVDADGCTEAPGPTRVNLGHTPVAVSVYEQHRYRYTEAEGGCSTTHHELKAVVFIGRDNTLEDAVELAERVAAAKYHEGDTYYVEAETVVGVSQSVGSVYYC
jgi:hypothetical protein